MTSDPIHQTHPERKRTGNTTEGFALVGVLLFTLIVAAVLTPFTISSANLLRTSANVMRETKLGFAVEGAAMVASAAYLANTEAELVEEGKSGLRCAVHGGDLSVRVLDHAGMVDLNAAPVSTLSTALEALGLDRQTAIRMAHSIIAFRTGGAFIAAADVFEPQFGFKQAPFEAVVELQEFEVLRSVDLDRLEDIFTVQKKHAGLSGRHAIKPLQTAFQLQSSATRNGAPGNRPVTSSGVVTIDAQADLNGGVFLRRKLVIGRDAADGKGLKILHHSPVVFQRQSWTANDAPSSTCPQLFGDALAWLFSEAS